jgi:hypothetical protein
MHQQAAIVKHNATVKKHGLDLIGSSNKETERDVNLSLPNNRIEARIAADGIDEPSLHSDNQCSGV